MRCSTKFMMNEKAQIFITAYLMIGRRSNCPRGGGPGTGKNQNLGFTRVNGQVIESTKILKFKSNTS